MTERTAKETAQWLIETLGPEKRSLLQDVAKELLATTAEAEVPDEWDGFPSQLDLVAAMIYNARAQSPREMTPERWARIKRQFRGSAADCIRAAELELEDL